jgi:transglycosylase-like protein with SLT domain
MAQGFEQRWHERRQGERRSAPRDGGPERREGERRRGRQTVAVLALAALAGTATEASAQIYTRRNERGVVEATNAPDEPDFRLTYPGKGTLIHSAAYKLRPSYNGEFNHHINAAAKHHGVDVDLVRAVIQVESDFDQLAVSSKGARGLMQLMPDTAKRFGVSNAFDPRQNVFAGVRYLRFLLDMFQNNVGLALAAYNAGENAVLRFGGIPPFKETRAYVQKIQALVDGVPAMAGFASPTAQAAFFAPNPAALLGTGAAGAAARAEMARRGGKPRGPIVPARPRVYYRWKDAGGGLHVAQAPPPEGTSYTMIRALD